MTFRVGQKVVCVDYITEPGETGPIPQHGGIYTLSNVWWDFGDLMVDLVELPFSGNADYVPGYLAKCFRPVVERKTDISIFTAMLNTSKQGVEA